MLSMGSVRAQHVFRGTSLSEALIELDQSSPQYDVSFVYDELEDFTVSCTVGKDVPLPDAVRQVCGFYPVRVIIQGREIFVECMQKSQTKLIGRLVDAEGHPVAYANIALYNAVDQTTPAEDCSIKTQSPTQEGKDFVLIGGGVSNEVGDFVIPCRASQVRVRISCVGFKTIDRLMPVRHVGTIRMEMEDYYLRQVTVHGSIPVIRWQTDRLEYYVARDSFARGQNALELMNRVPMVSVSGGVMSILGRGHAGLMINGRVVDRDAEAVQRKLWSLQAEDIERIEVVPVPSGRYRTDTGGGYINIVLNRDQTLGWRGDLSGTLAVNDDWNWQLGGTANYATKGFDASLELYGKRLEELADLTTTYQRPLEFEKYSDIREKKENKDLGTGLTLHFQPTRGWETGAMLSYRQSMSLHRVTDDGLLRFGINYAPFAGIGPDIKEYTTASVSSLSPIGKMHTVSLTAYSDWQLGKPERQISLTYNFYNKSGERGSLMDGHADIPVYYGASEDPYHLLSAFRHETDYRIHSLKLDFCLPWYRSDHPSRRLLHEDAIAYSGGEIVTIETGLSYTDIDNTVDKFEEQSSDAASDSPNLVQTSNLFNSYSYQERTAAAYLSLHKQILPQLSASVSLNWEHSWLWGEELDGERLLKTRQTISRLLPSLNCQLSTVNLGQFSLQMGRTIDRPDFDDLNRVPVYMTMTHLISGNPGLSPGLTDYAGLTWRHACGLYAHLWYRHGKNQTDWVTRFLIGNDQQYTVESQTTRPENWLLETQSGLFLRYQLSNLLSKISQLSTLNSRLSIVAEANLYYYHGQSVAPGLDRNENDILNPNMPDLEGWGKAVALSADVFLNRSRTLLFNVRYDHWFRQLEKMTDTDACGSTTLSLRYTLPGDRLKLSLTARDPFHQHVSHATRTYSWFTERVRADYHSRLVSLTATWSLGGSQVRRTYRDKKDAEIRRAESEREIVNRNP